MRREWVPKGVERAGEAAVDVGDEVVVENESFPISLGPIHPAAALRRRNQTRNARVLSSARYDVVVVYPLLMPVEGEVSADGNHSNTD